MKIFLDDTRPAPNGWTLMLWPHEVIAALQTEQVTEISLDHDLGDDTIGTGYDVLVWLEGTVARQRFDLPVIHIHTANSAARPRMLAAVAQIEKLAQARPPRHPNKRLQELPEALAALQPGAKHPARWPSWYDHTGSSEQARRWIESIYAAGATQVMLEETHPMDEDNALTAFLQVELPTDNPQAKACIHQTLAQWASASCIDHEATTLTLCLTSEMLPWLAHEEARAWLAASTAQQPRTLGHRDGPLPKQAAQQLIDGLYARRAAYVTVEDLQATGDSTVAWALRVTLPTQDPAAKRRLQAVCWVLNQLLEVSAEQPYEQAKRALHASALSMCTELAHELHCTRDETHALIHLQFLFFSGWGELLQSRFSLATPERTSP